MESVKCLTCDLSFITPFKGAMGKFCPLCKNDLGLENDEDAQEMLNLMGEGKVDVKLFHRGKGKDEKVNAPFWGMGSAAQLVPHPKDVKVKPPVDPKQVALGQRTMIDVQMAPVRVYEKPITYVLYEDGLYEVRHSDLATITSKAKTVLGVVEKGKEGIEWNLPPIPFILLQQTISFFRAVCKERNSSSEALVQIWWDREKKEYSLYIPEQEASAGGVHPTSIHDEGNSGQWFRVGDIHSHGSGMGAFFSGTDDGDERNITTERVFGVIGRVAQAIPEWAFRMRTRDGFIPLNLVDVFEIPEKECKFTIPSKALFEAMGVKDAVKDGRVSLSCPVDPFEDVTIPAEWVKRVSGSKGWMGYRGSDGKFQRGVQSLPSMRGYLYVSGQEMEICEDGTMKPTGCHLMSKEEQSGGQKEDKSHGIKH
jgi:PRTRC genetic system protein A